MANWAELSAARAAGFSDLEQNGLRLAEALPGHICSVSPYKGRDDGLAEALGVAFPAPGKVVALAGARLIWCGPGQAMWVGDDQPPAGLAQHAALVDQSDGWCVLHLTGERPEEVLARLCPLDLAPAMFKQGQTARSLLGHMTAQITRIDAGFELMVFRSMAGTACHELTQALRQVAARRDLSI